MSHQVQPAERPPRGFDNKLLNYGLKGLGLVLVAVVSGLIYVAFLPDDQPAPPPQANVQAGEYSFEQHQNVQHDDCAKYSYGEVKKFFAKNKCSRLDRALYTTTAKDGARVVVSVAAVRMESAELAAELNQLATRNGTGNVNDLLKEKLTVPDGPKEFKDAGYASVQDGDTVIIAESDFFDVSRRDANLLKAISEDALRLGKPRP